MALCGNRLPGGERMRDWHRDSAQSFLADTESEFGFLSESGFRLASAEQLPLRDFPHRRVPIAEYDAPLEQCAVAVSFASELVELSVYHDPRAEISVALREKTSPHP